MKNKENSSTLFEELKVNGKQVRFYVASDSANVKEMAKAKFKQQLFMLDEAPHHIASKKEREKSEREKEEILHLTLVDWYVLTLADELVANRYEFFLKVYSFIKD